MKGGREAGRKRRAWMERGREGGGRGKHGIRRDGERDRGREGGQQEGGNGRRKARKEVEKERGL